MAAQIVMRELLFRSCLRSQGPSSAGQRWLTSAAIVRREQALGSLTDRASYPAAPVSQHRGTGIIRSAARAAPSLGCSPVARQHIVGEPPGELGQVIELRREG